MWRRSNSKSKFIVNSDRFFSIYIYSIKLTPPQHVLLWSLVRLSVCQMTLLIENLTSCIVQSVVNTTVAVALLCASMSSASIFSSRIRHELTHDLRLVPYSWWYWVSAEFLFYAKTNQSLCWYIQFSNKSGILSNHHSNEKRCSLNICKEWIWCLTFPETNI